MPVFRLARFSPLISSHLRGVLASTLALSGLWALGCSLPCPSGPVLKAPEEAASDSQNNPGVALAETQASSDPRVLALRKSIDRYAVAELSADLSTLSAAQKKTLNLLIEASAYLDPVFDRQAWAGNPALMEELAKSSDPVKRAQAELASIMRGPWDRQNNFEAFAVDRPHPPGAGYYPEGLDDKAFTSYIAAHPEQKAALMSLTTVVKKRGDTLVAEPYSKVYAPWLQPAAKKLQEAAATTKNQSLARFLRSRAAAFASDDYYPSDKDWMDLDSRVEITIGPYEVYEDKFQGLKAAFESYVTVADPEASTALAKFKAMLPDMEKNLPLEDQYKTVRGAQSPIRVADVVYTSGDARKSVQSIAFNLPNDERVRAEKGAKKVLLRNLIKAKFEYILKPIGEAIIVRDQSGAMSAEAFFQQVLFHELSHSLGPAYTTVKGEKQEIRVALGANYSPLEEAKADVMGVYNLLYMIERGEFPASLRRPLLITYFAGLFRSVRFGVKAAHGRGAAVQLNHFLQHGAAYWDQSAGGYRVVESKMQEAVRDLVHELCMVQVRGEAQVAASLLNTAGVMTPKIERALRRLEGIPVDIRPVYPLAGEKLPSSAQASR